MCGQIPFIPIQPTLPEMVEVFFPWDLWLEGYHLRSFMTCPSGWLERHMIRGIR
jgi:hypothetical protein